MRHYEIVIMVHPDQSEQVQEMVKRYETMIKTDEGSIHRFEDWGRRQLAYPINKIYKAHYILMNIECNDKTLKDLVNSLQFNDAIIRHLVLAKENPITTTSPILKAKANEATKVATENKKHFQPRSHDKYKKEDQTTENRTAETTTDQDKKTENATQ